MAHLAMIANCVYIWGGAIPISYHRLEGIINASTVALVLRYKQIHIFFQMMALFLVKYIRGDVTIATIFMSVQNVDLF